MWDLHGMHDGKNHTNTTGDTRRCTPPGNLPNPGVRTPPRPPGPGR